MGLILIIGLGLLGIFGAFVLFGGIAISMQNDLDSTEGWLQKKKTNK